VRSLADIDPSPDTIAAAETVFRVHADFVAGGALAEHVLLIMLEGLRNTMRHAAARSAEIRASRLPGALRITIDDDGMGFERSATPPWSIASRVAESGGDLMLGEDERAGAHLDIRLPSA
jgi:signal transduction histidine kinase